MIAKKILSSCLNELKAISDIEFACCGPDGAVLVETADLCIDPSEIRDFSESGDEIKETGKYRMFRVADGDRTVYVALTKGRSEKALLMGRTAASEIYHLHVAYGGRAGKDAFFQDLLLNNPNAGNIYDRAKDFRIKFDAKRAVYIVEQKNHENGHIVRDVVKGLFGSGDFVTALDDKKTIIIKELKAGDGREDLKTTASMIADTVNAEAMLDVRVSCGGAVNELKDIHRSFMEASLAMDVGKIFYDTENVAVYSELGVGRLIYQLPEEPCVRFLHEIFGDEIPEKLDDEMLLTVRTFLENSLNVSETARQLFVHRNTLLHRLEKIEKATGLDIRVFDDALTLKISMMVMDHVKSLK